jgi:CRP/FNR family transcriptional regulator, nitrogen oxide reductase regulator
LSKADLNFVLSVAKHRQFRASTVALHEGDPAERGFLLTSGHGRQFVTTKDGRRISLLWLTAGQTFGGNAIVAGPMRHFGSTELLSESCALMWDRQTIRELVFRYPILLDNALSIAATEYIASLISTQVSLSSNDARRRIAQLLASLACGIGKVTSDGVELQVTNEDLASGANVTLFTVSRFLGEWQRAGVLTKGRGYVVLRKPELLATDA